METTENCMDVIDASYALAVTHNILQTPVTAADKNDQSMVRFINQNPFIFYIIRIRFFSADNTVCVRSGDRNLP